MAARLLGTPVKARATGVALVDRIAELSAREGYSLFLLGAAPGVAEEAAQELARRHPGVQVAGIYAGSPRTEDWPEIKARLEIAQPEALLVAYGAPRQDLWIREHRVRELLRRYHEREIYGLAAVRLEPDRATFAPGEAARLRSLVFSEGAGFWLDQARRDLEKRRFAGAVDDELGHEGSRIRFL
jgi:hypothetical protein